MLFCTDGCISVVDKATDSHSFVFYIEMGEKDRSRQELYARKRQKWVMPTLLSHTLLLIFWNTSPQSSCDNHCLSEREFGPFHQGYCLSSLISLTLAEMMLVQVQRHIRRRDAVFPPPLLFCPTLSPHKMQVESASPSCEGWGQTESYVGTQESCQGTNNLKSTI